MDKNYLNSTATQLQIMQQKIDDLMNKLGMQNQAVQQQAQLEAYKQQMQAQILGSPGLSAPNSLQGLSGWQTAYGSSVLNSPVIKQPPKKIEKLTNMLGKIL